MEQEELLSTHTYPKLSDLLPVKLLLRKIQLTSRATEGAGSWGKKNPKPGFFGQLSGLAGRTLPAAQSGRRRRHNSVKTRQLKAFPGVTWSLPSQEINRGA